MHILYNSNVEIADVRANVEFIALLEHLKNM